MYEGEGDGVDGLAVLDDHVEPVLVVHDGAQAHDAHVDVVCDVTNLPVLKPRGCQLALTF